MGWNEGEHLCKYRNSPHNAISIYAISICAPFQMVLMNFIGARIPRFPRPFMGFSRREMPMKGHGYAIYDISETKKATETPNMAN